ncbi:MAG: alcohol dehydrogenase catalytic domain-containing protein [Anaerolineae bacterium]|nr:alcohol dehydrogenase catalytic domain-containing protein [Anaerolineae bacterium]
MQAAFFHGVRDIRVREISDAEPKAGEVLIAVTAVGICGSDLHTYLLGNIGGVSSREPIVLGHEAGGVILALGPEVPSHLRVGQRVAIDPATPCLQCEFCQHGQHHLCLNLKFMGYFPQHGALQERIVHPARSVVPVPDSISDVGAAMLEPLGVSLHAARLWRYTARRRCVGDRLWHNWLAVRPFGALGRRAAYLRCGSLCMALGHGGELWR